jgi:hypothetical protein
MSFGAPPGDAFRNEIDAWAFAITDVRNIDSALPISVVAFGTGVRLDRAAAMYEALTSLPPLADPCALLVHRGQRWRIGNWSEDKVDSSVSAKEPVHRPLFQNLPQWDTITKRLK